MPRQAPTASATAFSVGTKKRGNDGNTWVIIKTQAGVRRWKRLAESPSAEALFKTFAKGRVRLRLAHLKRASPGDKLRLVVFSFPSRKAEQFVFNFQQITPVTGRTKKWYAFDIHGRSKYLSDLPMTVFQNGEVRVALSSDLSPVYFA